MIQLAHSRADLANALDALEGPIGLVPTMGALHAGHAALIEQAREICESVVVSIFVNPLQFGANEDLAKYPRPLERDLEMCERLGADLAWVPAVEDVYPGGEPAVTVTPGPLGSQLEGVVRPGHFEGVLTVVAKLFGLVRPAIAFFGEKDYQQLTLIRLMSGDLELGVGVAAVPTVREADGLALSSRNVYLSEDERRRATVLSRALFAGQSAAGDGAIAVITAATAVLAAEPGIKVDYLELRNPDLGEIPHHGAARLLVAARVGTTRLIDNVAVQL